MKPYIINSFRRNNGGAIFTRTNQGANPHKYVNQNNANESFHGAEFICNGKFTIFAILRQKGEGAAQQDTFTVGDTVTINNTKVEIKEFILIDSEKVTVIFNNYESAKLEDIEKWVPVVAPVPVAKVAPAKNGKVKGDFWLDLENQILQKNLRPIRLEKTLRKTVRDMGLEKFLKRFYEEYNNTRATIYVDDESVQTVTGKRRSIGDIFMICRYYFEDCGIDEVYNVLINILPKQLEGFRSSWCKQINKRTFYFDPAQENEVHDLEKQDEYNNLYKNLKAKI